MLKFQISQMFANVEVKKHKKKLSMAEHYRLLELEEDVPRLKKEKEQISRASEKSQNA